MINARYVLLAELEGDHPMQLGFQIHINPSRISKQNKNSNAMQIADAVKNYVFIWNS